MFRSKLQRALERGLSSGGDLVEELYQLSEYPLQSVRDAKAVCQALARFHAAGKTDVEEFHITSPLHALTGLFQDVSSKQAYAVLRAEGLPQLLTIFDAWFPDPDEEADDLLFVLKIFAAYCYREGLERIVAAARKPLQADSFMWSVVFQAVPEDCPHRDLLVERLREPLPVGFIAVALLDYANGRAIAGDLKQHPFDTPEGKARLRSWLESSQEDETSYAQSAAASLPFVSPPEREPLLALAMDHEQPPIQLEAAWASAKLGSAAGLKMLGRLCLDRNQSSTACDYLKELGREDVIPSEALKPDFQAVAEMCQWLAHPQEFGRPPDDIEIYDQRELHWPPTGDTRPLWLLKYRYEPSAEDDEQEVGVGLVGSITFALFGEATSELEPEDVYALYCCWELQMNDDLRTPEQRSITAGRAILREYNEGF